MFLIINYLEIIPFICYNILNNVMVYINRKVDRILRWNNEN